MNKLVAYFRNFPFKGTRLKNFVLVSLSATFIYTFVGLRGTFYEPFRMHLGVTNAQFGILWSMLGFIQIFGYLLFGWVQENANVRKLLGFDMAMIGIIGLTIAFTHDLSFLIYVGLWCLIGLFQEAVYWPTIEKSALRYLELKGILPRNSFLYTIFMSEHTKRTLHCPLSALRPKKLEMECV